MKQRSLVALAFITVGLLGASPTHAMVPTLSLSGTSGSDSVQVNVTGDPNAGVILHYNIGGAGGELVVSLGKTDANGSFSTTISASGYAINTSNSAYVVVNGVQSSTQNWSSSSSGGGLTLSQNSITLAPGQNSSVTVYGGNGNYTVTNNSNTSAVSTTLSGSIVTAHGVAAGSANITVCDQSSHCATFSVTVGSGASSSALSFSQANPSIAVGQSVTVNITGGSGYYVSGNSNSNAALPAVNGNVVTISGIGNGSATITICSLTNGCGTITVNVGSAAGTTSTNSAVVFGVTNPTIAVGQTMTVSISGSSGYFLSSNPNPNVVQANVSGNAVTLTGLNAGSVSVSICAQSGGCNTLPVTVTGATTTVTTPVTTTTPTTNASVLAEIKSMQSQLTQILSAIQTMQTRLTQLAAAYSAPSTQGTVTATPTGGYTFVGFLSLDSTGAEVTELQKFLTAKGFYAGPITGTFGPLTESAVKLYQAAHGIPSVGYVGPSTRAALNAE